MRRHARDAKTRQEVDPAYSQFLNARDTSPCKLTKLFTALPDYQRLGSYVVLKAALLLDQETTTTLQEARTAPLCHVLRPKIED